MALLHHHPRPEPAQRAGLVLAFLVGFTLGLVPSAALVYAVVPALVPLGHQLLGPTAAGGITVGTAAAVGLATAVCVLARSVSRR